jgi:hypothetical protein
MRLRETAFVFAALLLCGCSEADWNWASSYDPPSRQDTAADSGAPMAPQADTAAPVPPQPPAMMASSPSSQSDTRATVTQAGPTDDASRPSYSETQTVVTTSPVAFADSTTIYCRGVAQNAGAAAMRNGMDGLTQQRSADVTYRQCMALSATSDR